MKTGHDADLAMSTMALSYIAHLHGWAQDANRYIDTHNAPSPDDIGDATHEELIAAMEDLSGLMQRYADSLRNLGDREPRSGHNQTLELPILRCATLLQFPTQARNPAAVRARTDHEARPVA